MSSYYQDPDTGIFLPTTDFAPDMNERTPTGNASVDQVLINSIFSNALHDGLVGTMPNNGAWVGTGTPTGNNQVNIAIPAGYHNGSGYVTCKGQTSYTAGYNAGYAVPRVNLNTGAAVKVSSGWSGNTYTAQIKCTTVGYYIGMADVSNTTRLALTISAISVVSGSISVIRNSNISETALQTASLYMLKCNTANSQYKITITKASGGSGSVNVIQGLLTPA